VCEKILVQYVYLFTRVRNEQLMAKGKDLFPRQAPGPLLLYQISGKVRLLVYLSLGTTK